MNAGNYPRRRYRDQIASPYKGEILFLLVRAMMNPLVIVKVKQWANLSPVPDHSIWCPRRVSGRTQRLFFRSAPCCFPAKGNREQNLVGPTTIPRRMNWVSHLPISCKCLNLDAGQQICHTLIRLWPEPFSLWFRHHLKVEPPENVPCWFWMVILNEFLCFSGLHTWFRWILGDPISATVLCLNTIAS